MSPTGPEPLQAKALMRPYALLYFYRKRLRVHTMQELLAGLGVAVGVALVFAVVVANGSIAGSATEVARTVVGPARLQLRARTPDGFDERLLGRVEHLPGVKQAAPLLEQTATVLASNGRRVTVDVAGTDISLAVLDGLAHTLPIETLAPGGIGLSKTSASQLGIASNLHASGTRRLVSLRLRGRAIPLKVTAVLDAKTVGALSQARVAVMPLERLQQLAVLNGRITRILVEPQPGHDTTVRRELQTLAGNRLTVAPADQDVALLRQALRPSNQASALFAAISALLGFLFAFNAMLLTVPERRQVIADLRLAGTKRTAIIQMILFQAVCLGVAASLVGLLAGYTLSLGIFHQSPGYLTPAFTLGTGTVIGFAPALLAFFGGVLATCLASLIPLLDLRGGRPLDAVQRKDGVPGNTLEADTRRLSVAAAGLIVMSAVLFALIPSAALLSCVMLALATLLAVPLVFVSVLRIAGMLGQRYQKLTSLPVALTSLKATTLRSLALAATGALALFGSIALDGSREGLLRGIAGYASHYSHSADVWVINPGDNQAINDFLPDHDAARLAQLPGVAGVSTFQGSFLDVGDRRVWVLAWPPDTSLGVLDGQIITGDAAAATARLRTGGWAVVSQQVASEHHAGIGDTLSLPTPSGSLPLRIAATTTNFGWSPGAILMSSTDYSRAWETPTPTALGITLTPSTAPRAAQSAIEQTLGTGSGLEVLSAETREARINASAREGLSQLGDISKLLVLAAILVMAAALGSSIWQRRVSLAGLRLSGAKPRRLRRILLVEAGLMLAAGCLTGTLAGMYGQIVIDGYLKHVTGFPVTTVATGLRPLEILALVIVVVMAIAAVPGWLASRVPPRLALDE